MKMIKLYEILTVGLCSAVVLCGCASGYSKNTDYQDGTDSYIYDIFGKSKKIIFSWDGSNIQPIRAVGSLSDSQAASLQRSSSSSKSYACLHVSKGGAGLCDGVSFDLFEERQFRGVTDSIVGTVLLPLTLSLDILEPQKKGANTVNTFTNVGISEEAINHFALLLNQSVYNDYVAAKSQQSIDQFESFMETYKVELNDERFASDLIARYRNMGTIDGYLSAFSLSLDSQDADRAKQLAVNQQDVEKVTEYLRDVEEEQVIQLGEEVLTYEVENSHSEGESHKTAGFFSRAKATVRDVNTRVRVTMNMRPLDNDYIVRLKVVHHAEYQCISSTAKTSYPIKECDVLNEDRDIGEIELILSKSNNWSAVQEIDSRVAYFAVHENAVMKRETVLSKLAVEPELMSIEAIR